MSKLKGTGIRWTSGPIHAGNQAWIQSLSNFRASLFTGTRSKVMDPTGLPRTEGFLEMPWFRQLKGNLFRWEG